MTNGFPPIDKSFEGLMRDTLQRVTFVERRLGSIPDRISANGAEVTDWNDATSAGFYWSQPSALNNPVGNIAVGEVLRYPGPDYDRVFQQVYFPTTSATGIASTWRRIYDLATDTWLPWVLVEGATTDDTGWVGIPLASGFIPVSSGEPPQARRIGRVSYFRGGISPSTGTFAVNTNVAVATAGAVPAQFRPPLNTSHYSAGPTAASSAQARFFTDGAIQLRTGPAANYLMLTGCSFPLA